MSMSSTNPLKPQASHSSVYEIKVHGHLEREWAEWFDKMTIRRETNGDTTFTGPVTNQAALHRLLTKVRNLGLLLLSIVRIDPGDPDP